MKIAVIGAGAIGCVTGALLKDIGHDVTLIARPEQAAAINSGGLVMDGVLAGRRYDIPAAEKLEFAPELAILAVKTQDVEASLRAAMPHIESVPVVTMQNGVKSDEVAADVVRGENIVSAVVMFGATYLEPGRVTYNFPGSLVIGAAYGGGSALEKAREALTGAFEVHVSEKIHGAHWTKLVLNLNNAISAVLGTSLQEAFSDERVCALGVMVMNEAYKTIASARIRLEPLPDLPLEKLESLLFAPAEVGAGVYCNIMQGLSSVPLPGSVLQSISRGKPSEVEYLNGEIVQLARQHERPAPLNEKLCELVRRVESSGRFLSVDELLGGMDQ